jgi:fumarate hydratase class II
MTDANQQAPKILDLPIGLDATGMRQEFDSLGTVEVPAGHYWGAQTRGLLKLAVGGTAVGTGLNAPVGFGEDVAAEIASMTGTPYVTAPNKFTAQGTLDRLVRAHGGLKAAAVTLFKIANDLRLRAPARVRGSTS